MSSLSTEPGGGAGLNPAQETAINTFIALPTTPAGQHLAKDATGAFVSTADTGAGGGTPGGTVGQLQYNNTGVFGGTSGATASATKVTFTSSGIEVIDVTDVTKKVSLNVSNVSTLTTRTLTIPNADGVIALTSNTLGQFGATTSAQLASVVSDETGVGVFVLNTSPTLVTPNLGTPSSATLTNATGLPVTTGISGLATGVAAFLATPSSANLAAALTDKTGTGSNVFATSPTLTTPALGTPTTLVGTNITGTATALTVGKAQQLVDTNGLAAVNVSTTASAVNALSITNAATTGVPKIAATGTDANIDLEIDAKGTGQIKHSHATYQGIVAANDGVTITFDMSLGNNQSVTMAGNRTLALSNVKVGQVFMLRLSQDATGTRVPVFFTTIKWAGGVAPTLTTTASKADTFGFICMSAGNYDGFVVGQNI